MSEWHIPRDLMLGFSANPGDIDDVAAASVEQHLTACQSCQGDLAALSTTTELEAIWHEVEDRVDRAGFGFVERLLHRLGVESGPARLMAATPALRIGALSAVGLIVVVAVLLSRTADTGDVFLFLAPVIPTVLVGLSFAPGADPAGECGLATPVFGFGLVMRRAFVVEVVAVLVLALGSVFVPIDGPRALGWLIPALALSLATLAASVRWSAPEAAGALTLGWLVAMTLVNVAERGGRLSESTLFGLTGQLFFAAVGAGACVVVAANRQVLFQEVER